MPKYELMYILSSAVTDNDVPAVATEVDKFLKDNGGTVLTQEMQGKKKLAYKINREDFAVYVYMDVKLPADAPLKISNTLNITDEVLRYLLASVDEKGRKALEEAKARKNSNDNKEEE